MRTIAEPAKPNRIAGPIHRSPRRHRNANLAKSSRLFSHRSTGPNGPREPHPASPEFRVATGGPAPPARAIDRKLPPRRLAAWLRFRVKPETAIGPQAQPGWETCRDMPSGEIRSPDLPREHLLVFLNPRLRQEWARRQEALEGVERALPDGGRSTGGSVATWAARRWPSPLWSRWRPARSADRDGVDSPIIPDKNGHSPSN